MLDCGADPNICGGGYATALQAASCYSGLRFDQDINLAKKIVQLLIEHGADVNTQGGEWGSALHAAAASAHSEAVEVMKLLLEKGTKVNQQGNSNQGTALQVACNLGTIEAVHFLLNQGADVNAEGGRFGTSLQAAAARSVISHPQSKVQILKLLIHKGANINQQGREFGTALQAVCRSPNVDLIRLLLEYGADVNVEAGRYGTALIAACGNRWTEPEHLSLLLDRGANINAQVEKHGTALIAACQRNPDCGQQGIMEVVQLLLDRGADINAQGGKYGTALSAACFWGNSKLIQLLLSHGADIHLRDCAAWHAATCCVAIRYGDTSVLELLLDHGMDVNHAHAEYGNALHAMITAKDVGGNWRKGVGVLFKYHINPTITSEQSGSALHIACAIKHENEHAAFEKWCFSCKNIDGSSAKTKHLLEQYPNINVNVRGGMFGSALQAAAYSGQALSVRLLLDKKARVNARGGKYRSALNGAIISGYCNIVKILLKAGATPDCHLQEQPDEKWLQTVLEEDGRGAVESPVIQSLSIKTDYGRLTGCGNGEDKGWLYFLVSDPPALHERDLDGTNSTPLSKGSNLLKQSSPPALTHLASTYAQKAAKRWVFFQISGKGVRGLEVQGNNERPITSNARPGSPLAATSFIHKEVEVLVLYYIRDSDGVLTRSHSTDGGVNWKEKDLEGFPSQETLSAASNATFEQTAVVFSANDTNETQIHKDEWESILRA
ncbi:hypothetical protein ACHAPV_000355 [Trichoderma viride]